MQSATKNAMKSSLKGLLKQKPLNKITISDIAEDCGISRMTFYYHFKDIYDLVDWCVKSDAHIASPGKKNFETWQEELLTIFKVAFMNKEFYLTLFKSMDRELSERYIFNYTFKVAVRIIDEHTKDMEIDEDKKLRMANYFSSALMGVISCWAIDDMKDDPEMLVEYINNLFLGIPSMSRK